MDYIPFNKVLRCHFSFFHELFCSLANKLFHFFPNFNRVYGNRVVIISILVFSGGVVSAWNDPKWRFWAIFGKLIHIGIFKITTFWPPLDERVRSSFEESCKK